MDTYDRNKWIYIPDYYTDYRYILGTVGNRPLICIGINPSTAEPDNLDNTLKSVNRISNANGFDSFIMFNVYPQRATNPDDMHREINKLLHENNMREFDKLLSDLDKPVLWAAWGTLIEKRDYLPICVREMISIGQSHEASWVCAGKRSKKGHPHHPLYLKKDELITNFDVENYIDAMLKS